MPELRPEEQWAAAMIEAELGVPVIQHDDGTAAGMHDLNIQWTDRPAAAVEVTAAADAASIELWNLVNGSGKTWIEPTLLGGWMITLLPTARAKRLRAELPTLLAALEATNVTRYEDRSEWTRLPAVDPREKLLEDLQVVRASRGDTSRPGSIYLTIELQSERSGGFVDPACREVPGWVERFLADDAQADVRDKLQRSQAEERHAFVICPGFSTAPFGVVDMLWSTDGLPTEAPRLPEEITHVWLVSTMSFGSDARTGVRWSPEGGWRRFERLAGTG